MAKIFLILFLITPQLCFSAADTARKSDSNLSATNTPIAVQPALSPSQLPLISAEEATKLRMYNELLNGQLDILKRADDQLLKTVHWTTTTVFSVVILIFGYNWYTSFKQFEREKAALKEEIINSFEEKLIPFENDLNKLVNNITKSLNESQSTFKNEIATSLNNAIRSIDEKFAKLTESTQEAIALARKYAEEQNRIHVTTVINELEGRQKLEFTTELSVIKDKINAQINNLQSKTDDTSSCLQLMQFRFFRFEDESLEAKKSFGMAYTAYFNALETGVSLGWEWVQKEALEMLIRTLRAGVMVTKHEKSKLDFVTKRVLTSLKEEVAIFISLANNAPE